MKVGILLQETGYDFSGNQRLGIYLTNALEKVIAQPEFIGFAGFITEEANAATEVKRDKPIMVVLGNPPYSVSSANKGEHIEQLMERYKDAVRGEQNIQPLSDDYIKFIRFAHDRIERTGYGVIGMITNHSYLPGEEARWRRSM
jgi:predicted helicase